MLILIQLQVLLIQSCQGPLDPNQQVVIRLQQMDGDKTDALGLSPDSAEDPITHIKVTRPNMKVVCATPPNYSATRHLFLLHMAKQFREADGKTTFSSMITACSRLMSQDSNVSNRAQAPSTTTLMRLDLILPRSLMYDRVPERQGLYVFN